MSLQTDYTPAINTVKAFIAVIERCPDTGLH